MREFKVRELPKEVFSHYKRYTFLSALDRIGHTADSLGFDVIRINVLSEKREALIKDFISRYHRQPSYDSSDLNPKRYYFIHNPLHIIYNG